MPSSPASPGKATKRASPEKMDSSALTTSTWMVFMVFLISWGQSLPLRDCGLSRKVSLDLLGFFERFVDCANHVERLLGQVIALASHNHFEAANRFGQADVLTRRAGEHFSHVERLGQETLDLAGTCHSQFVFWSQLVHAQNRNNVAQFFVALQRTLHRTGGFVVVLTDHQRIQLTTGGIQWIHSGVNTQ